MLIACVEAYFLIHLLTGLLQVYKIMTTSLLLFLRNLSLHQLESEDKVWKTSEFDRYTIYVSTAEVECSR